MRTAPAPQERRSPPGAADSPQDRRRAPEAARATSAPLNATDADELVRLAARARIARDRSRGALVLEALTCRASDPVWRATIDEALARVAGSVLAGLWEDGWQPGDLVRLAGHHASPAHTSMFVDAVARQALEQSIDEAPEAWRSQLDDLGARVWWDGAGPHLDQWASRAGLPWRQALGVAADVLASLLVLPPQPKLCPPPSAWGTAAARAASRAGGLDQKVLTKVRGLLAKAESTEFPEEAEALTAKAQELIARHAIDRALLDAADPADAGAPDGRRVPVDDPYAAGKATLLQEIALANRCRAVWNKTFGFCTVFGYQGDLDAVELFHASLLVQGTSAMVAAGPQVDADGVVRTRSFRSSFLTAFAHRIGERLRDTTSTSVAAVDEALGDGRLLPVLAAREDAVEEMVAEAFPRLVSRRAQMVNRAGWVAGRVAADAAELAVGARLDSQRRLSA